MTYDIKEIFSLLPSIYRLRDAEQGGVLEALLSVLAREIGVVEDDIAQLYENWFIETCDEWVVPYIGDLLGVRGLHSVSGATYSQRAYVANTLAYRRRKGTATMLEQLARDVTGWPARVVEFFQLLATAQYMNHIRPHNRGTVDLRDMNGLDLLNGPFERAAHTADVRRIAARIPHQRGKYNIPNVGLFLWRLQSYPVAQGSTRKIKDGCFTFNPVGLDAPLFNSPQTETEITHLAQEVNVPGELRRRALYDELEALRQTIAVGGSHRPQYFGDQPVLTVYLDDAEDPLPAKEIAICYLKDWRIPSATRSYVTAEGTQVNLPIQLAIDPLLGRIRLATGVTADKVRVSYSYGFSGDYGGGPYNRQESIAAWYDPSLREITWQKGVTQDPDLISADPSKLTGSLQTAVDDWNDHSDDHPDAFGVITIMDSRTYEGHLNGTHRIEIRGGRRLAIVAASWPLVPQAGGGSEERIIGQLVPTGLRPHVLGDVSVEGITASGSEEGGELILDGLLIEGKLTVLQGNLGRLRLSHTTLVPSDGGLLFTTNNPASNQSLEVVVSNALTGPIQLSDAVPTLSMGDCLIDGLAGPALTAPGAATALERCTIVGGVKVRSLEASNCVFTAPVIARRRQIGCVRFSFIPDGSKVPRRYRCQPDLEIGSQIEAAEKNQPGSLTQAQEDDIRAWVISWLAPSFTSLHYGDPAYGQLDWRGPAQILEGADDGAEMGVFHDLLQPQRQANLRASLDEYLRAGLQAGIIYVS